MGAGEATTGIGVDTGGVAERMVGAGLTALTASCDKDAGFDGEPGLGGRDGCSGELTIADTGFGAARVPGVGSVGGSGFALGVGSAETRMVGGGGFGGRF